jgi:CheY-like chemotaxis protein
MDIHLPGITGLEATKIIKANPDTASIPVLAVTARAMHGEKENFIKAGCDDYIAKPYAPDELIKTVRTWLTSRETD